MLSSARVCLKIHSPLRIYGHRAFSSTSGSSTDRLYNVRHIPPPAAVLTNQDLIQKDYGLRSFLNKTYLYTGGGILSTLLLGVVCPFQSAGGLGFCAAIVGCLGMYYSPYDVHTTRIQNPKTGEIVEAYTSKNSPFRVMSYMAVIGGMGVLTSPIIAMAHEMNILLPAIISTSAIFGGATLYANSRRVNELASWGAALYSGLNGLIVCGIGGLASAHFLGPSHLITQSLQSTHLYGGLLVFTAYVAYDTHYAIQSYEEKDPDHLGCSLELFLDASSILVRMIRMFMPSQDTVSAMSTNSSTSSSSMMQQTNDTTRSFANTNHTVPTTSSTTTSSTTTNSTTTNSTTDDSTKNTDTVTVFVDTEQYKRNDITSTAFSAATSHVYASYHHTDSDNNIGAFPSSSSSSASSSSSDVSTESVSTSDNSSSENESETVSNDSGDSVSSSSGDDSGDSGDSGGGDD